MYDDIYVTIPPTPKDEYKIDRYQTLIKHNTMLILRIMFGSRGVLTYCIDVLSRDNEMVPPNPWNKSLQTPEPKFFPCRLAVAFAQSIQTRM